MQQANRMFLSENQLPFGLPLLLSLIRERLFYTERDFCPSYLCRVSLDRRKKNKTKQSVCLFEPCMFCRKIMYLGFVFWYTWADHCAQKGHLPRCIQECSAVCLVGGGQWV